jgi:hypothetical protein
LTKILEKLNSSGCDSGVMRLLIVVLCILALLSPTMLVSRQAHAQDSYDDLAVQMQEARQALAELLNLYQSADADTRAVMDSTMAQGAQEALRQTYGSLSASDRAYMDEQFRQMTGYTFPQFIQVSSTIPGLVKAFDLLIGGLQNLSAGEATTTTPPAKDKPPEKTPEPETKTVTLTLYVHANIANGPVISGAQVSGQEAKGKFFNLATNSSGYVTITGAAGMWSFSASGSGYHVNAWRQTISTSTTKHAFLVVKGLAWQIFKDDKMSDETARGKLQENLNLRKANIMDAKAAAQKHKADLEKARANTKLDVYIGNLEIQLALAKSGRIEALDQFFQTVGSEARHLLIETLPGTLDKSTQSYAVLTGLAAGTNGVLDSYPALKTLQEKYNKNERLTSAERAQAGEAAIDLLGVLNDATSKNKIVGLIGTGAKLTSRLLDLAGAQMEVDTYQTALQQLSATKQYEDLVLQHRIDVETMKIQEYDRQLERLKLGGYIDPKYLNFK